jgi:hypothetical protein
MMMNSDFIVTRGLRLAERLQRDVGDDLTSQIRLAWRLVFAVEPTDSEIDQALQFVHQQTEQFAAEPLPPVKDQQPLPPTIEAMGSFCHALLSSNRFLYID